MYCTNCGSNIEKGFKFCPECGESQNKNNNTFSYNSSEKSINIGIGNEKINDINIGQINVGDDLKENNIVEYKERVKMKLPINSNNIKTINSIVTVIGTISSIITVLGLYLEIEVVRKLLFPLIIISTIMITCFLFIQAVSYRLKIDGEFQIGTNGHKFRMSDGKLIVTEMVGECLICGHAIYLKYNQEFNKLIGRCTNYHEHIYSYDPTVKSGVPLEIQKISYTTNN